MARRSTRLVGADSTLVTFAITGGGALRSVACLEDSGDAALRDDEGPSPLDACAKARRG